MSTNSVQTSDDTSPISYVRETETQEDLPETQESVCSFCIFPDDDNYQLCSVEECEICNYDSLRGDYVLDDRLIRVCSTCLHYGFGKYFRRSLLIRKIP